MAISKLILNGEVQMDVTSDTVSAGNMLSGITGTKNDGTKATGNIVTRTSANLTASGSTVTAAAGYYATSVSKSVAAGSAFPPAVTITTNPTFSFVSSTGKITASYTGSSSVTPTVTSGYVTAGTAGTISTTGTSTYTLTTQAAQTLYPSTADQTVASYRWLTGTQTFKSVTTSNLTAENIAEGVVVKVGDSGNASRITQVTGTHSGATTYTATISGNGNSSYCFVKLNGTTTYYTNGSTFSFKEGDELYISVIGSRGGGTININGTQVASNPYEHVYYTYTLPAMDISIQLIYESNSSAIITTPSINITVNGTYDVVSYGMASVDLPYYEVYKRLISTSTLYSSINGFTEYLSNISYIGKGTFCNIEFSTGTYVFSNLTFIPFGAFNCLTLTAWNTAQVILSFPICSSIGNSAFARRQMLTEVYFPNCSLIGNSAFYSCNSLITISFPSCTEISSYAFYSCLKLISANFPNCTSLFAEVFDCCYSLTTINFPICQYIDASAFRYCSKITEAIFPSCSYMGNNTFFGCSALTTVSMPLCSSIGISAFYNCSQLSSITFTSCNIIGGGAFMNCIALSTANFPSCTSIGANAFTNCSSLAIISFPSCTYISTSAFRSCTSLTQVSFPACSIVGPYVFSSCTNLTIASFPTCTSMSMYTFYNCVNLISLYLNNVSVVPSISTNTFISTPISTYSTVAGRYGSVFVPSSLYADFLSHSIWKSYSARLVSV